MKTTINTADRLQALEEIIEYVTDPQTPISQSSDYLRGYKRGIGAVKNIIIEILTKHNVIDPEEE